MTSRKINIIRYLSIALLLLFFLPLSVNAQKRLKFSTTEDIAIAFYKTGGIIPNFERWIKERKPYNITPWSRRKDMMETEMSRLRLAYKEFDPKNNFLLIRTFVTVTPKKYTEDQGHETYSLHINFSKVPDALYFPYDFLGERIVVVPHKLDTIMNNSIEKSQYDYIQSAIQSSPQNTMVVRLLPKKSDLSKPYRIDGLDQWAFTTDIASLEIWDQQKHLLWEYTAPWYISPNITKLNSLFKDRAPSLPKEEQGKSMPFDL